jgi:putative oxidoreductase
MSLLYPDFHRGRTALGLLFVRVVTGTAFILHGWPKLDNAYGWMDQLNLGVPWYVQAAAAGAEVAGGILLVLGLLTPLAALALAGVMIGAIVLVHPTHPFVATGGKPSSELAVVYLANSLLSLLAGPGIFSVDALLFGRRNHVPVIRPTPPN